MKEKKKIGEKLKETLCSGQSLRFVEFNKAISRPDPFWKTSKGMVF